MSLEIFSGGELSDQHLGGDQKPYDFLQIDIIYNFWILAESLICSIQASPCLRILLVVQIVPPLEITILNLEAHWKRLESERWLGSELVRVWHAQPQERLFESIKVIAALFVIIEFEPHSNSPNLDEKVAVLSIIVATLL
jgi:hypothetical protein